MIPVTMRKSAVLLVLFNLLGGTQSAHDQCIEHNSCTCELTERGLVAACIGMNLTGVPKPRPGREINVLLLQFNTISRLRSGEFSGYSNLSELYVQGNKINLIEESAFDGLESLRRLDLSRNLLRVLPASEMDILSEKLEWLSVAMNAVIRMPRLLGHEHLKYLNISNNKFIKKISRDSFPSSLLELDLHSTGIKRFERSFFEHLHKLTTLLLNDNTASSSLTFEAGVFNDLASLSYLDLSRCFCKGLQPNSFIKLSSLETLLLNNCWLVEPPVLGFSIASGNKTEKTAYNGRLARLDLSNNRRMKIEESHQMVFPPSLKELRLGHINIPTIYNDMLKDLSELKTLDLCNSKVATIGKDAFRHLLSVTELCLSGNPLENLPPIPPSLISLKLTDTELKNLTRTLLGKLPNVVEADLQSNQIQRIQARAFDRMTSLRALQLSFNNLRTLKQNSLVIGESGPNRRFNSSLSATFRSTVLTLNLSFNAIEKIECGTFSTHGDLVTLDLQGNKLKKAARCSLSGLESLKTLRLNQNRIKNLEPATFSSMRKLELLYLDENLIEVLSGNAFDSLTSLKELHLSGNELVHIEDFTFPSLQLLDVTFNNFRRFPRIGGENLKEIRVAWNFLKEFHNGALNTTPSLEYLDLSHSNVRFIDYGAFEDVPGLLWLDLTGNNIIDFVDHQMPSLEALWMSENYIFSLDRNLKDVLPNMTDLDLSYNNISSVNPTVLNHAPLSDLQLLGNNFKCDCNLLPLVQWVEKHPGIAVEAEFYLCETPERAYTLPVIDFINELDCGDQKSDAKGGQFQTILATAVVSILISLLLLLLLLSAHRKLKSRRKESDRVLVEEGRSSVESHHQPLLMLRCYRERKRYERGRKASGSSSEVKESTSSSSVSSTGDVDT